MPECKDCKLRIDKEWKSNKETWKPKPRKKKKKKYNKNRKRRNNRQTRKEPNK